jgi:hypothetical protein
MLTKADKLRQAIELLAEADAMIQEALGASDECYDLHCGIEDIIDEVEDAIVEMEAV